MDKEIKMPFEELVSGLVIFCYETRGFYTLIRRKSGGVLIHSDNNIFYTFSESNYKKVLEDLNVKEIRRYEIPVINLLNFDIEDLSKYSYTRILLRIPESEIREFIPFNKSDLKSGMLVEFEDEDLGVVINEAISTRSQRLDLSNIKENLSSDYINCTINKVFKPIEPLPIDRILIKDNYQLIWDREKIENQIIPKYLTVIE